MPRFSIPIVVDGKVVGVACGRRPNKWCSSCGRHGGDKLCDYPVKTKSGTCDRALCSRCAVSVGPGKDHCPAHHRLSLETKAP